MSQPLQLVWIRRDLRLYDHAALSAALARPGRVQPVFVFDTEVLQRFTNPDDRRLSFLAAALCGMDAELRAHGGRMLVVHGPAKTALPNVAEALGASSVTAAEDFEPATRARDKAVADALSGKADFKLVLDHLVQHPASVMKDDGTPYRVFTPFSKAWRARLKAEMIAQREVALQARLADAAALAKKLEFAGVKVLDCAAGPESMLAAIGYRYQDLSLWPVSHPRQMLAAFAASRLEQYKAQRDFVAVEGTSRLSPYLRFGLVSVRECARLALEHPCQGADTWLNELIWREFYAMILFHFPEVALQEFNPAYRGTLRWSQSEEHWECFKQGMTGFPIVDAAMRELLETGWMHNRARMIVASFMTKDLHLDWRRGEEHFAQYLMDYELASNNGGWQWAASTGTDAQPYFRIFNPVLQSKKFDPQGSYIRRYVPELAGLSAAEIHQPELSLLRPKNYPLPIVDHFAAKEIALSMFKEAAA